MNCQEIRQLIDAYADNELDAASSLRLDEHLADCPQCSRVYESRKALRSAPGNPSLYYKAPEALRKQIGMQLGAVHAIARPHVFPWRFFGIAASLALVISLSWIVLHQNGGVPDEADEVLASHVRSMQAEHLFDVPSGNPHQVKPWLDARLNFAPAVPEMEDIGFKLEGGRLDYLNGHPVAALVYGHKLHIINLFISPDSGGADGRTLVKQGFNLIHFKYGGMSCWAVSDMNVADLQQFVDDYQSRAAAPATGPATRG